jgi:aspartate aminotransferase-like enzyme
MANREQQMKNDTPNYILMTPGPVPLPPQVLEVLAMPMEHHRTPEFIALWNRVLANLKRVFVTEQPAFIHTSTGSGGMESALVNCISPGDHVICVVSGKFGERWAEMAEVFGARVTRVNVPWGKTVKIESVEDILKREPATVAVLCQSCETSTGVLHPIRELAKITANHRAILMVDAITALGALPLPMDEWGIDVMVGGSQKAFMLPAGLSFICFSKKAWALTETAKCPRYYFDIRREKAANDNGESFFSSAVTHVRALDLVLEIFLKQGLHRVHERIQALSHATILAAKEMGLKPFAEVPSPSITALLVPEGIDGLKIRAEMEKTHSIIVMGGQDQLKGKIIRIGNMGAIRDEDLLSTLKAIAACINSQKPNMIPLEKIEIALNRAKEILMKTPAVILAN